LIWQPAVQSLSSALLLAPASHCSGLPLTRNFVLRRLSPQLGAVQSASQSAVLTPP
jgi:hypothetical protein